ncbi:MAG TPA: hypothetical protein DCE41_29960, partial [Cytophagales bacterium]|nr:hypothetical protein [Cytophagales bacterium]
MRSTFVTLFFLGIIGSAWATGTTGEKTTPATSPTEETTGTETETVAPSETTAAAAAPEATA